MVECSIKDERCGGLCTGFDGSAIWAAIHAAVDRIDCETCKEEGKKVLSAAHDLVNLRLGKPAFDIMNFKEFVKIYNCVDAQT